MKTPIPPGRNRWITNPSTFSAPLGVLIAVIYTASVISLPEGTRLAYFSLLIFAAVTLNVSADLFEQRRLSTVRGLSAGTIPATDATLTKAALEAAAAPDVTFFLILASFTVGSAIVGWGWFVIASPPVTTALRMSLVGVMVAPLTAVLASLLVLPRSRQVLEELMAAGLAPQRLAEVLPPKYQLRRRLVIFSVVAVTTPLLMVADASIRRTIVLLEQVMAAPNAEAAKVVLETRQVEGAWLLAGLGLSAIAVVIVCGWLSGSVIGDPLRRLGVETERLARGTYERDRVVMGEVETWAAALAASAMEAHLLDAVSGARTAAQGIRTEADALVVNGSLQEQGAAEQSAALLATTATTEELARSARQISSNAQQVSEIARGTLASAQAGKASADSFTSAMGEVRQGNQAIADSVVKLNKRVQQVGRIIEFIDGIADKSDLLALNAELEGHKAGAVGQGFGLVAAEMRRLAESVMTSTREIARLIDDIRDATNAAVMATEAGVKATEAGASLATQVSDSLSQIVEFANLSSDAMQSISLATVQQQGGTDQLVAAMADINRSTSRNLGAVKEMGSIQSSLLEVSKELQRVVDTLGGGAS